MHGPGPGDFTLIPVDTLPEADPDITVAPWGEATADDWLAPHIRFSLRWDERFAGMSIDDITAQACVVAARLLTEAGHAGAAMLRALPVVEFRFEYLVRPLAAGRPGNAHSEGAPPTEWWPSRGESADSSRRTCSSSAISTVTSTARPSSTTRAATTVPSARCAPRSTGVVVPTFESRACPPKTQPDSAGRRNVIRMGQGCHRPPRAARQRPTHAEGVGSPVSRRSKNNRRNGQHYQVRRSTQAEMNKAAAPGIGPGATTYTGPQVAALLAAVNNAPATNGGFNPLPRLDPQVAFGPGLALIPAAIDPVRRDTARPEPRFTEYPVSTNLPGVTDRLVPWKVLRDAASAGGIPRRCIQIRKDEITTLEWAITVTKQAVAQAEADSPSSSRADVEADLRKRLGPQIARCSAFWERPDPGQDEDWTDWIGKLLEEHLVLDGVAIYPRKTYGGDLYALEILDGSCYSDDTEVLTRRGWLRFADTCADDDFATRNPKTHEFEWQQATYFHRAPHKGDLYHFSSKSLDILVTGNHRMLVTATPRALGGSSWRERGESIVTAAALAEHGNGQASKIPMTSRWNAPDLGEFKLPASGRTTSLPFECSGDDFAAFMGAYLSEGCFTSAKKDTVCISQDPASKGYGPFRDLLTRIFGREVCHTGKSFVISRKCLYSYLAQFGKAHEKHAPDTVKNMSARQLEIFWRFYMLGDGCYSGARETVVTCSPRMADDLQEIAQKMGKCANVSRDVFTKDTVMRDGRVIRAQNKRERYSIRLSNTHARTWHADTVPYDGDVFCVSVPNEVLYVRRNGKPAWCGNTIKVLRDYRGGKPLPPGPAYQQILWGFPRGEYVADVDDQGRVINGYAPDTLIYKRRNVRTETLYGFSAVEQCLEDLDVWLRRRAWIRAEFTDGTIPSGLLRNTALNSWTPQQVLEYETALNDAWSGQTLERHRMRILPPGFELESIPDVAEKYQPHYDLFLLKQLASHFATTIAELNFTEAGGLGSTGYHEGQADIKDRNATMPTYRWIQGLITGISRRHLAMPPELEFRILGLEDEDEAAADAVAENRVKSARMTYNEDRDRLGLPRYAFAEADMPIVSTSRGVIFLEGASKTAPAGETISPLEAPPNKDANLNGIPDRFENDQGQDGQAPAGAAPSKPRGAAAKAEVAAYRNWARRAPKAGRVFHAQVLTKADAPDDMWGDARVVFATPGGGEPPPKAGDRPGRWPGWDRDLETAHLWAPRITRAMARALDTRALAEAWLAQQLVKADDADGGDDYSPGDYAPADVSDYWTTPDTAAGTRQWAATAALALLHRRGITLAQPLALLRLIWLEGYAIGDAAATAVLAGRGRVSAWGWAEGDTNGAGATLAPEERNRFERWALQASGWAASIANGRLGALAKALAGGQGQDSAGLAASLAAVLADASWAQCVALTELTRASSQAALDAYRGAGTTQISWGAEADERTCDPCLDNAGAGPLPLGSAWPTGVDAPPQHARCRCWLYPA